MSTCESNPPAVACPPTVEDLRRQAHERLDEIIAYCSNDQGPASFLEFETAVLGLLRSLGWLLIQLFLRARHDRLDPGAWQARGYRVADPTAERTLKTSCGSVAYVRAFLAPRRGGGHGVHPLDVALGVLGGGRDHGRYNVEQVLGQLVGVPCFDALGSQGVRRKVAQVLVARVHQLPAPAGSSMSNHDSRFLRAQATARSVPTVGFGTLPVSSFESVARSMPDRSETSDKEFR